jgi:Carboxypeptidase regulatory-like domain
MSSVFVSRAMICVSILLLVAFAFGQGTDLGTVRGVVTDPSGSVVPNATVSVADTITGATRESKSNTDGQYQFFGLRPGTYKVTVQSPGFASTVVDNVVVRGSNVIGVNVSLKLSSAQETVEVVGGAPEVNTESGTIADTIGSRSVIDLPRDTRDVYSFLYLNPNIVQADTNGDFKFVGSQSYGASFSLDGQRSNGGIFGSPTASEPSLEAVDEVNVLSNNYSAEYGGVANVRITTKRGGSGYHGSLFYNNKNSALAAWTLQDQIGKAGFAPSALEPHYPNPAFNINDLGGSVGGPIPKLSKTWFFAAYERDYNVSPVYIQSNRVAHPLLYTGNFSQLDPSVMPDVPTGITLTPQEIATDTYLGQGQQFTQIPSRLLNPSVQKLISTYFPHIGLSAPINSSNGKVDGEYLTSLPGRDTVDLGTLRLDHDFSEKDHVYLTYNASAETSASSPVQTPYTGLGLTQNNRQNHTVNLSYTRVIRPNLVNEARGGFNKENLLRHSNTTLQGFLSGIGFGSSDLNAYASTVGPFAMSTFGHPAILFSGAFADFRNGNRNTYRPMSEALTTFGDTLTWVKDRHSLKFGADFVRNWAVDGFALNRGNPRGSMTYDVPSDCNVCSNVDTFADFLLGMPPTSATYVLKPRPPLDVHNWEQGFFVQDDWKLTSKITLNLGVRYDLITPFIEKNDLLVNFAPNVTNPTGNAGVFIIPSAKTLPFLDSRIVNYGYLTAAQAGVGRGLVNTDKHDIAPRLGLAWAIGDKSVIRAGYGWFYPTSAAQGIRDAIGTNAFNQGATARDTLEGWPGFQGQQGISPVTGGTLGGFGNTPSANAVPVNLREPRIQQYNLTFERQIGWSGTVRVSYLGSHMGGLIAGRDLNELPPSTNGFGTTQGDGVTPCTPSDGNCALSPADNARYPFPIIGENLLTYGNFAHGNSNAFQTQFERRYKKGLLLNLSYTYLDQKSTIGDTANSSLGSVPYDVFSANTDYANDGFISRHRFVAYGVYDLPVGRGRSFGGGMSRWLDEVIGGWQTTFNMFAKSGTPYTPYWICDNCDPAFPGNIGSSSVDAVGDFNFPDFRPTVLNGHFYTGQSGSSATIWNASAFGVPPTGADFFSNPAVARRNILMGPSLWGVSLGVHKNFKVSERVAVNFGADFDNIFNHPLLAPDLGNGGNVGSGGFASVGDFLIDTTAAPRPGAQPGVTIDTADPNKVIYNPAFGQLIASYDQEGVSARREIRLRLRITF